jgi:hypothetical protein
LLSLFTRCVARCTVRALVALLALTTRFAWFTRLAWLTWLAGFLLGLLG